MANVMANARVECERCRLRQTMMESGRCRECKAWLPIPRGDARGWALVWMSRMQLTAAECATVADGAVRRLCMRVLGGMTGRERRRIVEQAARATRTVRTVRTVRTWK